MYFLFRSTNQHGVHSPFVYHLLTEVLYQKPSHSQIAFYNFYRNQCLKLTPKKEEIQKEKNGKTAVLQHKKQGFKKRMSKKRALLLMRLIAYVKPKAILDIGTGSGIRTASMAHSFEKTEVTRLESCMETSQYLALFFEKLLLKNIQWVVGDFQKTLPVVVENKKYNIIFFNRSQRKKDRLEEFYLALNAVHNDSVFIFDEIYENREMAEVWEEIKKNPKVRVTLDTYRWGFVFFRKEQVKEHFIIRV